MNDEEQMAAETKAMQEQALEVFKASGCEFFRANLEIAGTVFHSDHLSAEKIAELFPSLMGNLYIKSVEGFNYYTGWETI